VDPINGLRDDDPRDLDTQAPLPTMTTLHDAAGVVHFADISANISNEGVIEPGVEPAVPPKPAVLSATSQPTA
jgi:hypothetical protein